jgi:hypothetical protein
MGQPVGDAAPEAALALFGKGHHGQRSAAGRSAFGSRKIDSHCRRSRRPQQARRCGIPAVVSYGAPGLADRTEVQIFCGKQTARGGDVLLALLELAAVSHRRQQRRVRALVERRKLDPLFGIGQRFIRPG